MSWRASFTALADALRRHPRADLQVFRLFPPARDLADVPAGLVQLYRETDGVQLAWVDRFDPAFDPGKPRYEDAAAPWELPGTAAATRWSGAIWLLPAGRLAEGHLDTVGAGILLDGDVARLPDGTVAAADEVVRHLIRWWGSLRHRAGPIADDNARIPLEQVLGDLPESPAEVALAVHVVEVRRVSTEDATWSWVDRGVEPEALAAAWADGAGTAPAEIVEVELEMDALPPSLLPGACAPELVAQLLGPWSYPDRFAAAVDLSERPRWVIAFGAAPNPTFGDATEEATGDTEIAMMPAAAPAAADAAPDRPGFQYAVWVRHPGVHGRPRVHPAPMALRPGRTWRPFPNGAIHQLAMSPEGALVAAIAESGELRLWSLADGSEVPLETQREPESFSEVGFGRDGRIAVWDGNLVTRWESDGAAAGFVHQPMAGLEGFEASERQFCLWTDRPVFLDLRGDHHGTIDAIEDDPVSRSGLSPDGGTLAIGTEGGRIGAYRLAEFTRAWLTQTDLGEIRALAVSPKGRSTAAGGREAVVVLDAGGHEIRRLPAHDGSVSGLAWIGGDRFLVSAGQDRVVRVWCGRSGALLLEEVFPAPIRSVVTSSRWLAVATADRIVLLGVESAR